jgi:DNA-directed RNA polymerase subunit RPC12/RpoP
MPCGVIDSSLAHFRYDDADWRQNQNAYGDWSMITYACHKCGAPLESADSDEGGQDVCPACNAICPVPFKPILYKCPYCGAKLESPGELAGKQDVCPGCGKSCPVPKNKRQKAEEQRQLHQQAEAERQKTIDAERVAAEQLLTLKHAAQKKAEDARREARQARTKEGMTTQRNYSGPVVYISTCLLFTVLVLGLSYIFVVRPLQKRLSETEQTLSETHATLDKLTATVNHNADVANRATKALADGLDSLTETVNHNARIANYNNSLR